MKRTLQGSANRDHVSFESFEKRLKDARDHRHELYGREIETKFLQETYQCVKTESPSDANAATSSREHRRRSEFVLLCGSTGVGKSALAYTLRSQVEDDHGYFLCAEFDSVETRDPYQALGEALSDFVARIIERGDTLHYKEALRRHGIVGSRRCERLCETIPALQKLLGDELPCEEVVGIDSSVPSRLSGLIDPELRIYFDDDFRCFKDALSMFLRAIASCDKPIVLLLDNLHQANEFSLHVFQALIENKDIRGVLFLGTVTTELNESSTNWSRTLSKLRETTVRKSTREILPLTYADMTAFLMDVLECDPEDALSLAVVLEPHTKGNALLTWEHLRLLHANKILRVDLLAGEITWDLKKIQLGCDTLCDGVRARVHCLSCAEQEYIKTLSYLGERVDGMLLTRLISRNDEEIELFTRKAAEKELFHFDLSRNCWRFPNGAIKDMINNLVPDHKKRSCHYRIGRKLWRVLDSDELNEFIFLVVDELTYAVDGLNDDKEKTAIAKLCFCAGVRAFHLSSFFTSMRYLECGISLLGPNSWDESYDLCLDLYGAAAEVATSLGLYERVYEVGGLMISKARRFSDSVRVQTSMTHALGISGRHTDATKLAFELLEKLGEPFPSRPSEWRTFLEFTNLRRRLRARSTESILRLPNMMDAEKLAVMQLLNLVFLPAYIKYQGYVPLIAFRLVRLTLDCGLCAVSCLGFAAYAGILCSQAGDVEEGHRMSDLCFSLYEKFDSRAWLARLSAIYFELVHGFRRTFNECVDPLYRAARAGELGDVAFKFTCQIVSLYTRFETDKLRDILDEFDDVAAEMEGVGHKTNFLLIASMRQLLHNLGSNSAAADLHILRGNFFDETTMAEVKANSLLYLWTLLHQAMLKLYFCRYEEAAQYGKQARRCVRSFFGPRSSFGIFMCGLVEVVYARESNRRRAPNAKKFSRRLQQFATKGAPLNFLDKHYLLEAELAALAKRNADALVLFNVAIATAEKSKQRLQVALANERTARFLWRQGEHIQGVEHFQEAIERYTDYGAMAKALHLQNEVDQIVQCLF